MPTNDTPTASGATNVLLNQRALDAPYYRQAVHIQGDENPGKAIGFDADGVLTAIDASDGSSINVLSAGAENDDTGDQGSIIQSVIDDAATGSTILFPPGNYKVLTPITVPAKRLHFKGAGAHCTRINFRPASASALFNLPANCDNIMFSDIAMVGSGNPGTNMRIGAIKQLGSGGTVAATELFFDHVNFDQFTDDVIFLNAVEYTRISCCRFLANADIDEYGGSGVGTCTCIRTQEHANAIHLYKSRFSQNDRLIVAPSVTAFDISNNTFEFSGDKTRVGWTADYFMDLGTASSESRGVSFRNNYVEAIKTVPGRAFMRLRGCLGPMIAGNTFTGSFTGETFTHNFIEFGAATVCPRVTCNWFADVLESFMSVTGAGVVRAWDNTFFNGGSACNTKALIRALLVPSSGAFELDGDFIQRAVTMDAGANGEGFNVSGSGNINATIQSLSTGGSRSAVLDLKVANTGGSDTAGALRFNAGIAAGSGVVALIEALTNTAATGGQLRLSTAAPGGTMAARQTIDSSGNALFTGQVEAATLGNGFILKSPDGTRYRIQVANGGALSTTPAA